MLRCGINECCSVNVAACEGQEAACTPHEVVSMSFMINEALGIVLDVVVDEAVDHALLQSVACHGPF